MTKPEREQIQSAIKDILYNQYRSSNGKASEDWFSQASRVKKFVMMLADWHQAALKQERERVLDEVEKAGIRAIDHGETNPYAFVVEAIDRLRGEDEPYLIPKAYAAMVPSLDEYLTDQLKKLNHNSK